MAVDLTMLVAADGDRAEPFAQDATSAGRQIVGRNKLARQNVAGHVAKDIEAFRKILAGGANRLARGGVDLGPRVLSVLD
jgi:hypothetical protein